MLIGTEARSITVTASTTNTSNVTSVTQVRSARAHLFACGTHWWVLLQHSIMLRWFFIVECGIVRFLCAMHVFEVRASPHPLGYLCAKFCFFHGLHCWASPWTKLHTQPITHSLTHSTSWFDAPGTEVLALWNIGSFGCIPKTKEEKKRYTILP